MKITACLLILLFNSLLSSAQLHKGQWMVGGTADFSHAVTDNTVSGYDQRIKQTEYNFFPGAGYFFSDQFVVGPRIRISDSKTKMKASNPAFGYNHVSETKASGIGIGAFARYYFFTSKNKFNVFAEAAWSHSIEKTKSKMQEVIQYPGGGSPVYTQSTSESKSKANYYSFNAGPVLFLSPKVSFELSVGYTYGKGSDKITNLDQKTNQVTIGTGFQVYIGK
jgi:hypothetical protein